MIEHPEGDIVPEGGGRNGKSVRSSQNENSLCDFSRYLLSCMFIDIASKQCKYNYDV